MVKIRRSCSILITLVLSLSLVIAALLGSVEPVCAADFHVTTATEFQTALDAAEVNQEDDTIWLAAGVYEGNFEYTPQDGMSLFVRGETGTTSQNVILDGGDTGTVLRLDSSAEGGSVTIEGLTIQNGTESGLYVRCQDGSLDITLDCVVIQNNSNEYRGGGICLETLENGTANMEIWDSIIRYNQASEQDRVHVVGGGIGTYASNGNSTIDLLIVNSLVYGNQAKSSGGGIDIRASYVGDDNVIRAVVINSNITGNTSNTFGLGCRRGGGVNVQAAWGIGAIASLDIYNTILYNNTTIDCETGQDLFVKATPPPPELSAINREFGIGDATVNAYHCDIGDVAVELFGVYNPFDVIDANPAFADPANDDYHLAAGSPCIDTGTANVPNPPGLPAIDIEGNPRVWGVAPDIGAYEWVGPMVVWNCPISYTALISPYPNQERPSLSGAVDLSQVTKSIPGAWFQVYYMDAQGNVSFYDSVMSGGTLDRLEPKEYYWVVVSIPCNLGLIMQQGG